jgi:hypothetical protein
MSRGCEENFYSPDSSGRKGNENNEGMEQLLYRILLAKKGSIP